MPPEKPEITGTAHVLPFDKLSADDFERMCVWLVQREGFEAVEHLGAAGSEQGRDITAQRDGKHWAFQCKRVQHFSYATAVNEINKLPQDGMPDVYVFMVSSNVADKSRQKIRADYPGLEIHLWARTKLDEMVKRYPEIVTEFFQLPAGDSEITQALIQELQEAVENWKTDESDQENLHRIQKIVQSGGVNLGQGNQVKISGPVIGTVNVQFQTEDQAQAFLDRMVQDTPSKGYDTSAIRDLLLAAFSAEDLKFFIFDYFNEVEDSLTPMTSKRDMAQKLIEYADNRNQLAELLDLIKDKNPSKYKDFETRFI